jgi:hypothetical protein
MGRSLSVKYPFQMIAAVTVAFMFLNAFLPLNSSPSAETTQYPFKLTTTLGKVTYKLREPVNITLSLKNIGNENATVRSVPHPFDFIVYDENFIKVYRFGEDHGYTAIYRPPHTMTPKETINGKLTWHQSIGFEVIGRVGQPDFKIIYHWAKPGSYYIIGVFTTYNVTVQTPPIRITIIGA